MSHPGHDWDRAPVGLLAIDRSGVVRAANSTVEEWTGVPLGALVDGRRITDLLTVAGRMFWETHLSPLLHVGQELTEVSLELLSPAGRMPVLLSARTDGGGVAET